MIALFLWLVNDLSQVKGLYSTGRSMNDGKVKICMVVRVYIKVVLRNCAEKTEENQINPIGRLGPLQLHVLEPMTGHS